MFDDDDDDNNSNNEAKTHKHVRTHARTYELILRLSGVFPPP